MKTLPGLTSKRKIVGSPRQLENAAPTPKNPQGVWVWRDDTLVWQVSASSVSLYLICEISSLTPGKKMFLFFSIVTKLNYFDRVVGLGCVSQTRVVEKKRKRSFRCHFQVRSVPDRCCAASLCIVSGKNLEIRNAFSSFLVSSLSSNVQLRVDPWGALIVEKKIRFPTFDPVPLGLGCVERFESLSWSRKTNSIFIL